MEPYKDKDWLYKHYVQRRMDSKDICELLLEKYNVKISPQGLYNWLKKYDLLKYRGKGRSLNANLQGAKMKKKGRAGGKKPLSPMEQRLRQQAKNRKRKRRGR
jgi:IS30 family transposase